jgi:hypothetical protein
MWKGECRCLDWVPKEVHDPCSVVPSYWLLKWAYRCLDLAPIEEQMPSFVTLENEQCGDP